MDYRHRPTSRRSPHSSQDVAAPTHFEWTRQPGIGPELAILGELRGQTVVEVGCGGGHNLAHLVAYHDATGIGVDTTQKRSPGHAFPTGLDPVWCTSWRADAADLIGTRLGLPPWPHVELPRLPLTDSHPNGYLWKRDHVATYINDEPCAWIDDDFVPADHGWASTRTTIGRPTLLIQPDPHDGLLTEHVETIRRWTSSVILPRGA